MSISRTQYPATMISQKKKKKIEQKFIEVYATHLPFIDHDNDIVGFVVQVSLVCVVLRVVFKGLYLGGPQLRNVRNMARIKPIENKNQK